MHLLTEVEWCHIFHCKLIDKQRGLHLQNKHFVVFPSEGICTLLTNANTNNFTTLFVFLAKCRSSPHPAGCPGKRIQQTSSRKPVCLSWQGERIPQNWGNQHKRLFFSKKTQWRRERKRGERGRQQGQNSSTPPRTGTDVRVQLCTHLALRVALQRESKVQTLSSSELMKHDLLHLHFSTI